MLPRYFVLHFISDPQGAAMLTRSLLMKSRKRVANDAVYTYARLVHDVTDTDNGSDQGRVWATFKRRF